jgi:hypothetical protein
MSERDSSDEDISSNTSSAGNSPIRKETPFQPPRQLFDQYQALLSQTIDIPNLTLAGLLPTQPPVSGHGDEDGEMEGGRAMTKAEKQNAKKKRRKEREREAKQAQMGHHLGDGQLEETPISMSTNSDSQMRTRLTRGRFPIVLFLSRQEYQIGR